MRLRLIKGDIAKCTANAIVTSANDALCGNDQPLYWRFTNRAERCGNQPLDAIDAKLFTGRRSTQSATSTAPCAK